MTNVTKDELLNYFLLRLLPLQTLKKEAIDNGNKADNPLNLVQIMKNDFILVCCFYFIFNEILQGDPIITFSNRSLLKIDAIIRSGKDVSISDLESIFTNLSKYSIRQKLKELGIIEDTKKETKSKLLLSAEQLKVIRKKMFLAPDFFELDPKEFGRYKLSINFTKEISINRILSDMKDAYFEEQCLFVKDKNKIHCDEGMSVKDVCFQNLESMILTISKLEEINDRLLSLYKRNEGSLLLTMDHFFDLIFNQDKE